LEFGPKLAHAEVWLGVEKKFETVFGSAPPNEP